MATTSPSWDNKKWQIDHSGYYNDKQNKSLTAPLHILFMSTVLTAHKSVCYAD